jgi:chitin synthase
MVVDVEIMGLCGETKIANKADNFVTMMQGMFLFLGVFLELSFDILLQSSSITSHTT